MSLIFLFLHGGLSTSTPSISSPMRRRSFAANSNPSPPTSPTSPSGEHLPKIARHMDKLALLRSFRHHNSDHGPADHYMLTGYFPQAGFNPGLNPNNQKPAHGAIIARKLGPRVRCRRMSVCRRCTPAPARLTSARVPRPSSSTPIPTRPTSPCRMRCRRPSSQRPPRQT